MIRVSALGHTMAKYEAMRNGVCELSELCS